VGVETVLYFDVGVFWCVSLKAVCMFYQYPSINTGVMVC